MPPKNSKSLAPTPGQDAHKTGDHRVAHSKKATTACSACKRRKSKCIGGIPCFSCQNSKTECVFNADNDGRRRITLKRKIESLEQDRNLLMHLVDTIRGDDKHKVPSVLNMIRSNAPLDEIRLYLTESLDPSHDEEAPPKDQKIDANSSHSSHRYMDIKRLSDIPLYEVPAKPWTSVTNDDALVSHLISLHFSWSGCTSHWIDRDLFLRDMRSGKLDSRFCSPLLVNSILAMACLYTDYPEALAVPDDPSTRGEHFLEETMRLLKEEEGRLSLTTLQAQGNIFISLTGMGKDRLGWLQIVEVADCVREIEKKRHSMIAEAGAEAQEMTRAVSTAIFGLFNLCTISIMSLQKPAIIKRPTQLQRLPQDHDPKDTWTPYPRQAEPEPAHTNCVLNGVFDLMLIVWDTCDYFFGDDQPEAFDLENVDALHQRLQNWAESLPECIGLGCTTTPGVMDMHLRYYTVILVMFGFIEPTLKESDSASKDRIKALRLSAAHNIGTKLSQFRSRWPVQYVPGTVTQYSSIAIFTLLGNLDDYQSKQAFVEAFIVLRALARRWQLAKGILRSIQLTSMKMEAALPEEAQILFRDFDAEFWNVEDYKWFSSPHQVFAVSVNRGQDPGRRIGEAESDPILEAWDNLNLSEQITQQTTEQTSEQTTEQPTETGDTSNDSNGSNSGKDGK